MGHDYCAGMVTVTVATITIQKTTIHRICLRTSGRAPAIASRMIGHMEEDDIASRAMVKSATAGVALGC